MKLAVLKERLPGETRVAATPDMVKKYIAAGLEVTVERGAGAPASYPDEAYTLAGAQLADGVVAASQAAIVLSVRFPDAAAIAAMSSGTMLIGMLEPHRMQPALPALNHANITSFALELLPRISRAQSMDALSSQGNLAGYRAAIEAANVLPKAIPMMMTAAGTIAPAKALVLGAGVAGLQAIATIRRLGAVVSAFDVRAAAKEQVESLGAKFVEVAAQEGGETAGGYAKEMSADYQARQRQLIHDTIIKQDIAISTALIPGKPAPVLITEAMVKAMKPGAVIVDLAAGSGGNCELTEMDKIVVKHGVTLIGYSNLPARIAADASQLYARNLFNFVTTLLAPAVKWDDELIKATLLTRDGKAVHSMFTREAA